MVKIIENPLAKPEPGSYWLRIARATNHKLTMSTAIKTATSTVFDTIEANRQASGYYRSLAIPATPKGNHDMRKAPQIGDTVVMLDTATMKAGYTAKVLDRYKMNGFGYVVTDRAGVQRIQDVAKA